MDTKCKTKNSQFFKKIKTNKDEVTADWQKNAAVVAAVEASLKVKTGGVLVTDDQSDNLLNIEPKVTIKKKK